jgi:hypothetical protein
MKTVVHAFEVEVGDTVQTFTRTLTDAYLGSGPLPEWKDAGGNEVPLAESETPYSLEGTTEVRVCSTCCNLPQVGEFVDFEVTPGETGWPVSPSFPTYGFGTWACLTCGTDYCTTLNFDSDY